MMSFLSQWAIAVGQTLLIVLLYSASWLLAGESSRRRNVLACCLNIVI